MNYILFIGFCVLGGFLVVAMVYEHDRTKVNRKLAEEMLCGPIQHEAKALLKAMQSSDSEGVKIFTPLKFFCNLVVPYMRLGGSFHDLNAKLETIRSIIATKDKEIPFIVFSQHSNAALGHHAMIEVGCSGRKYMFDLHRLNSLDMMIRGLGIK